MPVYFTCEVVSDLNMTIIFLNNSFDMVSVQQNASFMSEDIQIHSQSTSFIDMDFFS